MNKWLEAKCNKNVIYLDANGTTLMCDKAKKALEQWAECYNPASSSKISTPGKKLIEKSKDYILKHCNDKKKKKEYICVFTSGGTESNCFIIKSTVDSFKFETKMKPHIITSQIEHHSILKCCYDLEKRGVAEVDFIKPNICGNILAKHVEKKIKKNTCIISIMHANNETGTINNIKEIGAVAQAHNLPFHTDAVQTFGKFKIPLDKMNIDALSCSFHKFYGCKGLGLLLLRKSFVDGYGLCPQIYGSQQNGLRGGTENPTLVACGLTALIDTFKNRNKKNQELLKKKQYLMAYFKKHYNAIDYTTYYRKKYKLEGYKKKFFIVFLGNVENMKQSMPNTLLFSIIPTGKKKFCNVKLKACLDKVNIVVSISSACLTSSKSASHVLTSINADSKIKSGTIRLSMSDDNTQEELEIFLKKFEVCILKQLSK